MFTGTAKDQLGRNTTVENDKSYITAGRDALRLYTKNRQKYLTDGMSAFDAHLKAEAEVLQLINTNGGKFAIEPEDANQPAKFKYYAPDGGYYQDIVQTNGAYALQSVADNPELLDTTYLVSPSQINDIYRAVQTNTPFQKPWIFQTLSENGYHDGLQRQLNKYAADNKLEPVTVPMSFDQYRSMTAPTPRVKRFMETATSPLEYKKYTLVADPTSYRNPALMSKNVATALQVLQIQPAEGGLKGLTFQDYQELAFIASAEAGPGDDPYLVAATALNRFASGKYGKSLYDIARAPGQYEAVYTGKAYYDNERAREFASPAVQRKLRGMMQLLKGRTDFKGQSQLRFAHESDVMVDPLGNTAHYAGQTPNSGAYTGPIDYSYERLYN